MIKPNQWIPHLKEKFEFLSHAKRVLILFLGWFFIYVFWQYVFAQPLVIERQDLKSKTLTALNENTRINIEIGNALKSKEIKSVEQQMQLNEADAKTGENKPKLVFANVSSEQLIKQIFNLGNDIKSINLKSNVISSTSFQVQVQFTSGYFETMNYLVRLERLPWCLSWDSLIYQVNTYPEATIAVILHTEKI
ncbi:MAG: hypothetical protein P4M12_09095 [Gammaproteobacteria bacterium]|nr:hypothetical protein [Gammaproteobacteria bacterium]